MLSSNLVKKDDNPVKDIIGEQAVSWLPVVLAVITFLIMNKFQQSQQKKATSGLIGKLAPDFEIELRTSDDKSEKKHLSDLIKEKPLPTVVDFYQNF